MAPLKTKGDMAEQIVAADLVKRGFRVAFPFGEDCDFDVIFWRPPSITLERVQVKYTSRTIDWLAVYDAATELVLYVPATELGEGMSVLAFRLQPARNNQRVRVRMAADYLVPTIRDTGP